MQFQNIHAFTHQKTLIHTLFCFILKSSKAFSVSVSGLFTKSRSMHEQLSGFLKLAGCYIKLFCKFHKKQIFEL